MAGKCGYMKALVKYRWKIISILLVITVFGVKIIGNEIAKKGFEKNLINKLANNGVTVTNISKSAGPIDRFYYITVDCEGFKELPLETRRNIGRELSDFVNKDFYSVYLVEDLTGFHDGITSSEEEAQRIEKIKKEGGIYYSEEEHKWINTERALTNEQAKKLRGTGYHNTRPNSSAESIKIDAATVKCTVCGMHSNNGVNSKCDECYRNAGEK